MTDPLGQSQVLPYLSALASQGYRFTILSFEKKSRFEKEKEVIKKITEAAGICWHPLFFTKNPPILSKVYDRKRMNNLAHKLCRQQRFDLVHCRSYVAAEVGLQLKREYGLKFLFDMRGFWADEKVDNGQWKLSNPLYRRVYRHYKTKENEFLKKADGIISLTSAAKDDLLKKPDYDRLEINVIPCCADLDHFNYRHIKKDFTDGLREQAGIAPGKKVISYLGSIGGWYMTGEMFRFFNRLVDKHPEFVMLVLTKDDPVLVKKQAAEKGIPADKLVVLYAGRNELPDYISLSDCSIFFIRPTYSKIASSPTKHAELMGMGVPVICNDIGDTGKIIDESQTGLVVRDFTDKEYDRIISKIEQLMAIDKEHIRHSAIKYFDLGKGAGDYLQVYKRILN